jgi:hypothetical protein
MYDPRGQRHFPVYNEEEVWASPFKIFQHQWVDKSSWWITTRLTVARHRQDPLEAIGD